MTVRVALVDDQAVVRAGFRALLDLTDDLIVVGEAADGREGLDLVRHTHPDVVLMDIRMPHVDGLDATRQITDDPHLTDVKVLVLTTFDADEYVFEALRAGASGFLLKDVDPTDLHQAIRTVAAGQSALSPAVTRLVVDTFARRAPDAVQPERLDVLTDREREVIRLVGLGLTNDEVASSLIMSPLTAKTHVSRAMSKLAARDRAQLVILAYETGLVRVGEKPT